MILMLGIALDMGLWNLGVICREVVLRLQFHVWSWRSRVFASILGYVKGAVWSYIGSSILLNCDRSSVLGNVLGLVGSWVRSLVNSNSEIFLWELRGGVASIHLLLDLLNNRACFILVLNLNNNSRSRVIVFNDQRLILLCFISHRFEFICF
jgi:hypothetical protein